MTSCLSVHESDWMSHLLHSRGYVLPPVCLSAKVLKELGTEFDEKFWRGEANRIDVFDYPTVV